VSAKVVHIALSHLVGHPLSIVKALNAYTEYSARFVNIFQFKYGIYENDLLMPDDYEEIVDVINDADIIHLHQVIELENNALNVDFKKLQKEGKKIIRQWSSEPGHYRYYGMPDVDHFLDEENVLHLVTGQYHERFYGNAIPVPLLLDSGKFAGHDTSFDMTDPVLAYSPSNQFSIEEKRWATKGYHEFLKMIKDIQTDSRFRLDLIEDVPHSEVLKRKAVATMVADEMCTGTYHTSALEGLALGKPTFSYLDQRTAMTLATMTGTNEVPFICTTMKQFPDVFREILNDHGLCASIGEYSRKWFNDYYHESKLIRFHADIYDKLLNGEIKTERLNISYNPGEDFLKKRQFDLVFNINNLLGIED